MEEFWNKVLSANIISSIVIAVLVIVLYFVVRKAAKVALKKHKQSGESSTALGVLFGIIRVVLVLFGIVVILQINGINVSAIAAGIGIVGVIIGLALQDFLKDIIMGVHILIDHFFRVGECVEYEGKEGVIVSMSLKTTKIGDLDDHSVFTVCNRNISQVKRLSERLDMDFPLSYKEDISLVNKTFEMICAEVSTLPDVSGCSYEGTQSFESSAILYRLRIICDPKKRADVRRAVNGTVQRTLDKQNIHIPFNQLDVHCDMVK